MDEKLEKKAYRDRVKLEALRQGNRDKFIQAALGTAEGRDYFYWLLEICKTGRNPFSTDALAMAFSCGEINVGQQVQAHIIEATPEAYLTMLLERQKEEVNGRRDSTSGDGTDRGDDNSYGDDTAS